LHTAQVRWLLGHKRQNLQISRN